MHFLTWSVVYCSVQELTDLIPAAFALELYSKPVTRKP